jgi:hypothetical protein
MPRFVILRHQVPADYPRPAHLDLMLERDGTLMTWAIERLPAVGETITAERLADHRLAYLDYEGGLTGGRGSVERVEQGEYVLVYESPGRLVARVAGAALHGVLAFQALSSGGNDWQITLLDRSD